MRRFAELYAALDRTNSTSAKVDAMVAYFQATTPGDAAWALFFLTGRRILRLVPSAVIRDALLEATALPSWLVEESHAMVGDLAETIALLVPPGEGRTEPLSLETWATERLLSLRDGDAEEQKARLKDWWAHLSTQEIFTLNKLVTGGFRAGVSHALVVRAVALYAGLTEAVVAHRLMGRWEATADFFLDLTKAGGGGRDPGLPYPFFLASPLEGGPDALGRPEEWLLEWKWDGIRAQAIRRPGGVFLWSRGEELITERFPDLAEGVARLPQGTVLDGEILACREGKVLPFSALQQRIGRKKLTAKILAEVPVVFMAFDLLESEGEDRRECPLSERRRRLESVLGSQPGGPFRLSRRHDVSDWKEVATLRERSREEKVEGLMLKRLASPYRVGRKRGDWWKWKVDPFTMDAVLVYAQPGHGRRATLYTDYTFAVWKGPELVPIAKAYSGLTDEEILEMDRWIRQHTLEKFGPVRRVEPRLVFELAFEAIAASPRHKSGLAVRFPRMLRRRADKRPEEADRVETLLALAGAAAR